MYVQLGIVFIAVAFGAEPEARSVDEVGVTVEVIDVHMAVPAVGVAVALITGAGVAEDVVGVGVHSEVR